MTHVYYITSLPTNGAIKMNVLTTSFTASQLQSKIGLVQDTVAQEGVVLIECRSRSNMVLMSKESHDIITQTALDLNEKVRQLTELVKSHSSGDSHKQQDLLKG